MVELLGGGCDELSLLLLCHGVVGHLILPNSTGRQRFHHRGGYPRLCPGQPRARPPSSGCANASVTAFQRFQGTLHIVRHGTPWHCTVVSALSVPLHPLDAAAALRTPPQFCHQLESVDELDVLQPSSVRAFLNAWSLLLPFP